MSVEKPRNETFEQLASAEKAAAGGAVSEFRYLVARNRRYWMVPIVLALLAVGGLLVLGGTAAAPLIYALF